MQQHWVKHLLVVICDAMPSQHSWPCLTHRYVRLTMACHVSGSTPESWLMDRSLRARQCKAVQAML